MLVLLYSVLKHGCLKGILTLYTPCSHSPGSYVSPTVRSPRVLRCILVTDQRAVESLGSIVQSVQHLGSHQRTENA